jgi:hypothetical protein
MKKYVGKKWDKSRYIMLKKLNGLSTAKKKIIK